MKTFLIVKIGKYNCAFQMEDIKAIVKNPLSDNEVHTDCFYQKVVMIQKDEWYVYNPAFILGENSIGKAGIYTDLILINNEIRKHAYLVNEIVGIYNVPDEKIYEIPVLTRKKENNYLKGIIVMDHIFTYILAAECME